MKLLRYNYYSDVDGYNGDYPIKDCYIILKDTDENPADYTLLSDTNENAFDKFHQYSKDIVPQDLIEDDVNNFGVFENFRDWKCLRSEIIRRIEIITGGQIATLTTLQWDLLTAQRKLITLYYAINRLTTAQINEATGSNADLIKGIRKIFDQRSTISRKKRFKAIRGITMEMFENISDAFRLLKKINELGLEISYYGGLEGVASGDGNSGLRDYIEGTNGFSTTGLPSEIITFKTGYNLIIYQTAVLNIMLDGIY